MWGLEKRPSPGSWLSHVSAVDSFVTQRPECPPSISGEPLPSVDPRSACRSTGHTPASVDVVVTVIQKQGKEVASTSEQASSLFYPVLFRLEKQLCQSCLFIFCISEAVTSQGLADTERTSRPGVADS